MLLRTPSFSFTSSVEPSETKPNIEVDAQFIKAPVWPVWNAYKNWPARPHSLLDTSSFFRSLCSPSSLYSGHHWTNNWCLPSKPYRDFYFHRGPLSTNVHYHNEACTGVPHKVYRGRKRETKGRGWDRGSSTEGEIDLIVPQAIYCTRS